jgi:hypothetical protein
MLGSSLFSPDDEDEGDDPDDVSSDENTGSSTFPPLGLPSVPSVSIRSVHKLEASSFGVIDSPVYVSLHRKLQSLVLQ